MTILQTVTLLIAVTFLFQRTRGCQFYPPGEYLRFVRVPENLPIGGEVLKIKVYPRHNLTIHPIDKTEDINYFKIRDINRTAVSLLLAQSLENLVDTDNPQNVLKFRLVCDYYDGEDTISSYLSVTVYVEDVNDHAPEFIDAPYHLTVDELTPVGLTIFRGIQAFDRDKPNTPNSDVQYRISAGDEKGRFKLESSHRALLVVQRPLDYDTGDREFLLTLTASDRGIPPKSTNTSMKISVLDNDDLNPKFTRDVYKTQIAEFYPFTGAKIHKELKFEPKIFALDQDIALNTPVRYDIVSGNERQLFSLDPLNGTLFLEREIDLESETTLPGNTFVLQIQASQIDNPLKTTVARVEVEILDLNDNLPEFEVDFYNISIVENLPNGFSVLQVIANDKDQGENAEFTYQIEETEGAFNLDSRTGWLTVREQSVLDREKKPSLEMKVYAKEKKPSILKTKNKSAVIIEVTLLDANDNNPTFVPNNLYEFLIPFDSRIGDIVGTVKAIDPDLGRNGMVLYDIQKTTNVTTNAFSVDAQSGLITVNESPLQEGRHALFVEATDQPANPSERRFSLAVVTVDVSRNDGKDGKQDFPDFIGAPYEFWVGANVGIGTSVGQVRVTEAVGKNIVYDLLHSYHEGVPFAVEERSGTITVIDVLEKFERQLYDFEAVVTNEKELSLVTNVTIHVVDPNDERGVIMKGTGASPIVFRVRENLSGALIGKLLPQNLTKNETNKSFKFAIANQADITDNIAISQDGTLYTKKGLDREEREMYPLTVIAEYNKGIISGAGIYQVTVIVDDENDNVPIFDHIYYEGKIRENSLRGTEVSMLTKIHATDKDKGANAHFTITLVGEGQDLFFINQTSGTVFYKGTKLDLDREEKSVYNFKLVARDKGSLSSEVRMSIYILDENDNIPRFLQLVVLPNHGVEVVEYDENVTNLTILDEKVNSVKGISMMLQNSSRNKHIDMYLAPLISLPENIQIGTPLLKVIAEDRDVGENATIKYHILSESYVPNVILSNGVTPSLKYFVIHPHTGEISAIKAPPPETNFRLNISATDLGGLTDNVTIRIYVKDVNDHAPSFKKPWYTFDAPEAIYSRNILGRVEAIDKDFGQNSNISYEILSDQELPFTISELSGILSVNGELDREIRSKYQFRVIATDNASKDNRLSSTVDVEVNVLDINDNAPMFYGYDLMVESSQPEASKITNHNYESVMMIPVYLASVAENSPVGTAVTRVFANDSDFPGNGNGLIIFNIPQRKNQETLFTVDSKDGVVTTIGKLDFEKQGVHNITIVATDLGSPSLSSTALLMINVIDVPEEMVNDDGPLFSHRYYEVEMEENLPVPFDLMTLNLTDKGIPVKFSIVTSNSSDVNEMFRIDPTNGTISVIQSPDREKRAVYEFVVRVDKVKLGRGMGVMIYPVGPDRFRNLAINEAKVLVRVTDVNDNVPKFSISGRPIIAAIPTSASFGYQVLRLHATDPDEGINGDIRYQILGRAAIGEGTSNGNNGGGKFAIDPLTGQVRAVASFMRDAGRVYGFDVKATDRRGADDGKSSIANVFVYVLDEEKQLVMVMGSKPTEVEKNMESITSVLFNVTGYDVRVRKLEPHTERNLVDNGATDMYLYAVDPLLNVVIDMAHLENVLHKKQRDLQRQLEPYRVLDIANGVTDNGQSRSQRYLLSTLEVGVVVLGCVIFISALIVAICITCVKNKRRNHPKLNFYQHATPIGYVIPTATAGDDPSSVIKYPPPLFPIPPSYDNGSGMHHHDYAFGTEPVSSDPQGDGDEARSDNLQVPSTGIKGLVARASRRYPNQHRRHRRHDSNCSRGKVGMSIDMPPPSRVVRRRSSSRHNAVGGLEHSITSLHSSGKDSGIYDGGGGGCTDPAAVSGRCQCGHSLTQSSGDSSNSYEDSLKSGHRDNILSRRHRNMSLQEITGNSRMRSRSRHSFAANDMIPSNQMIHRVPSGHIHGAPMVLATSPGTNAIARRHSDRLIMTCPVSP